MSQEAIQYFVENDFLISPELLEKIKDKEEFIRKLEQYLKNKEKLTVINEDLYNCIINTEQGLDLNWTEFEKTKAQKERGNNEKTYETFLEILKYTSGSKKQEEIKKIIDVVKKEDKFEAPKEISTGKSSVTPIYSYSLDSEKRSVANFVQYFRLRYDQIKNILSGRPELQGCISVNRLSTKKDRERVALIVMVTEKQVTKNGNVLLTVEDLTGKINILINKDMPCFPIAQDLTPDEVIGVTGSTGNKVVFANNVILPDIPMNKELKKCPEEVYAAFISDVHFGSKYFLREEFEDFVNWINGTTGTSSQKEVSKKLKYLFVVGDIVDGVGIYPGQEKNLEYLDVTEHYNEAAKYLNRIRKDVNIIICPGQHDAVRISEPQPPLNNQYTKALTEISNVMLVSNPALINIHATKDFPGFDVLLYHGASYHYFISNVDNLRQGNAYENITMVQKYLLQKRHLSPTHGATLYSPKQDKDPLVIDRIPDVFASGDSHHVDVGNYNNITLIGASCFQGITDFMMKRGYNPNLARVPLLNLKSREVKILNFYKGDKNE